MRSPKTYSGSSLYSPPVNFELMEVSKSTVRCLQSHWHDSWWFMADWKQCWKQQSTESLSMGQIKTTEARSNVVLSPRKVSCTSQTEKKVLAQTKRGSINFHEFGLTGSPCAKALLCHHSVRDDRYLVFVVIEDNHNSRGRYLIFPPRLSCRTQVRHPHLATLRVTRPFLLLPHRFCTQCIKRSW